MNEIQRVKFFRQLRVLIWRYATLMFNDKVGLAATLLEAPFMVLIVKIIAVKDCFTSSMVTMASQTVLFTIVVMAAFMGILASYREICKERDVIIRETSVGVSLLAVLLSKVIVLLCVALYQGAVLTIGFELCVDLPQKGLMMPAWFEIFVSLTLVLVASQAMGLLVSAALKNSESAILPVLLVIISQVVFAGTIFALEGVAGWLGNVVVSHWAMSALGATCNLNNRLKWLGLDNVMYNHNVETMVHSWQMLLLICCVCWGVSYLLMRKNFGRKD